MGSARIQIFHWRVGSYENSCLFMILINILLFEIAATPVFDVWDAMAVFLLLVLAVVFFICDYAAEKGLLKRKVKRN